MVIRRLLGERSVGMVIGVSAFFVVWALPLPLTVEQHRLLSVLALTFIFWVTEALPLPVTALFGVTLCILLGIADAKTMFSGFGRPVLFLLFGTFLLAEAIKVHGLDQRLAEWLLSHPFFTRSPFRVVIGFALAAWGLSGWMSNTATTATLYPLAWRAVRQLQGRISDVSRFGTAILLTCAYAASIGGTATIVGTPPNLIGLGFLRELTGQTVGFLPWMLIGVPIGLFVLTTHLLWIQHRFRLYGTGKPLTLPATKLKTPLSVGERNTALSFGIAVGLWMFSGLTALIIGTQTVCTKALQRHLPEVVPALLAAGLLFLLPADKEGRRRVLTWQDAQRIDWGTVILLGGGLALGNAIFVTGLAEKMGEILTRLPGANNLWGLTAWSIVVAVFATELISNTATTNVLIPLIIAAAKAAGVSPIPPALGAIIACSYAFMLPISTPPNAIVYASGLIPIPQMVRTGLLLDLFSIPILFIVLRVLCPLLDWA